MLESTTGAEDVQGPVPHAALRRHLHPTIQDATALIERGWFNSLSLSPYPLADEFGYVEETVEGEKAHHRQHLLRGGEIP
jgi:hypothetical protein